MTTPRLLDGGRSPAKPAGAAGPRQTGDLLAAGLFLAACLVLEGCAAPAPQPPPASTEGLLPSPTAAAPIQAVPQTPASTPTATAQPTATAVLNPTPDLSARPLVWFSPLPPLPVHAGHPFTGSDAFMELFRPEAAWTVAAGGAREFSLLGVWVAYQAPDAELRQVIADLNRRGMAIAFEAGPLTPPHDCGAGIVGFVGVSEGLRIARRIRSAGGTVRFVAFDHPYDAGVLDASPNACNWTPEETARNVARFVAALRGEFPEVIFGDTETARHSVGEVARWVDAYREAVEEDLGFLHVDLDFSRPDWPQDTLEIETYLRERGIQFGIIYFGSWNDRSDEAWLSNAGERVLAYEREAGGQPDQVVFQSWHDHPDRALPESEPYTFTWFINAYFADRPALGFRTEGPGANLAFGKAVRASRSYPGFEPERAVDGNPDTWWGSEASAPQWIEVDLGEVYTVAQINLLASQYPPGQTTHRVFIRGPAAEDGYRCCTPSAGRPAIWSCSAYR